MRFAIASYDRYLGVFEAFCQAGWVPVKLFTVPLRDAEFGNQAATIALAEQQRAAIQLSRMSQRDVADLAALGCDILIVAGYDWKVPQWSGHVNHAINFHPSPLPMGRGAYPLPRAILEKHSHWGVSCHRLSGDIDGGDILAVERFEMSAEECHESLDLRTQMAARRLAGHVARDFDALWRASTPQGPGEVWPKITLADKLVDFKTPVDDLLRHVRAYGRTGTIANIGDAWYIVKRVVGWQEGHQFSPGAVAHRYGRALVVAAADGFIAILDSERIPPEVAIQIAANSRKP